MDCTMEISDKNRRRWLYHATLPSVIVGSDDEQDALGPGWVDSPAKAIVMAQNVDEVKPEADVTVKKRGRPPKNVSA